MKLKFLLPAIAFITLANLLSAQAQRQAIGNLLVENVPEIPASMTARLEQYQNTRSAAFLDWDGAGAGIYIATRFGDVAQVHHVSHAGGDRQQLTFSKEPVAGASTCPDPARDGFLFQRDIGGNENFQLWFFDRKNGATTMLTDGKSRNGSRLWNKRGDKIAFTSTKRTGRDLDFYVASLNDPAAAKLVLENQGGGWSIRDWSVDETRMLVENSISINEKQLFLLDLASGRLDPLLTPGKQIACAEARFSKDGTSIYLITDEDSEFLGLRRLDLATRKVSKLSELNWDVVDFALSGDGTMLAYTVNEGGYSKAYLLNVSTLSSRLLKTEPKGILSGLHFNKDNRRLAFSFGASNQVGDAWVYDLQTDRAERWTFSETGGLNLQNFIGSRLIEFPTFDTDERTGKKRLIPAFLYLPEKVAGKLPVVIMIHGGPEGQSRPGFSPLVQFMANEMGIAVLDPNVRGSTGYGKTYLKLDNGVLRENSVKDIGALLDWIATQPNLDAGRVAVYGGSYGGYMSLACMTRYNERLRCGVDLYGISNFVTFLKNTAGYRVDLRRVEYGDERDPAMAAHLEKISPLTNIKNISKPMFIYQGENDPRVPLSESEQMLEHLKQNGVPTWYVRAKDEGHGIAKKANRDYTQAAIMLFLKEFLLKQ